MNKSRDWDSKKQIKRLIRYSKYDRFYTNKQMKARLKWREFKKQMNDGKLKAEIIMDNKIEVTLFICDSQNFIFKISPEEFRMFLKHKDDEEWWEFDNDSGGKTLIHMRLVTAIYYEKIMNF